MREGGREAALPSSAPLFPHRTTNLRRRPPLSRAPQAGVGGREGGGCGGAAATGEERRREAGATASPSPGEQQQQPLRLPDCPPASLPAWLGARPRLCSRGLVPARAPAAAASRLLLWARAATRKERSPPPPLPRALSLPHPLTVGSCVSDTRPLARGARAPHWRRRREALARPSREENKEVALRTRRSAQRGSLSRALGCSSGALALPRKGKAGGGEGIRKHLYPPTTIHGSRSCPSELGKWITRLSSFQKGSASRRLLNVFFS